MRLKHSIALSVLLTVTASGQEFEVADVKAYKLDQPASGDFLPSGQVTPHGVTMKTLIGIGWKESRLLQQRRSRSHPASLSSITSPRIT